jgi:hypothetical protein
MNRNDEIEPGNAVVLPFGAHGEQLAHVIITKRRPPQGCLRVRVWRKASKSWTKPKTINRSEIIRAATEPDNVHFAPEYGIAWDRED